MEMIQELAPSLLTAVRGVIAAFGCLCIAVHVAAPCVVTVGEFLLYELPSEIANWRLQWAQQSELQRLEDRVAALKKRHLLKMKKEARRALEDQKALSRQRKANDTRREPPVDTHKSVAREGEVVRKPFVQHEVTDCRNSLENTERTEKTIEKRSLPVRRVSRPLQLLSPNIPRDQRAAAYVKASAGVSKPVDADPSRHPVSSKPRVLSLGDIFDDIYEENIAPPSSVWAQ